ncbi:MAG: ABC transporter ATP-binding protein [Candidatus Latescibacteria bacterium]|nr:ABC transporter ATP-binding protein [Candidatus Latescibacterota bacterium]
MIQPTRTISPASERPPSSPLAVCLVDVVKEYAVGAQRVRAIEHLSLDIPSGQCLAVVGRSGSGKSTLLNLLAGIDTPTSGRIWVGEHELSRMTDDDLTRLRREQIGMVYQFFNLLSTLSVRENVALPALLSGEPEDEVLARAERLLEEVDLSHRRDARPHTLSGGELQRTALARALIHSPMLVLADEPTGNLDSRTADQVITLLRQLGQQHGATVVLVTHSREAAAVADRVVELRDGQVVRDEMK